MLVVAGELHVDIHFDADWHIGFEQAIHASVVFDCVTTTVWDQLDRVL